MFTRAGVVPTPRAPDLPSKLDERHIKRGQHQRPLGLVEQGLGCCDVFCVAVVAGDRDGFLLPTARFEFLHEGLDHEGLHHRTAVAENVSSKGVDHLVAVCPRHSTVNRRLGDPVAPVVDQRFPFNVPSGRHALDGFPKRRGGIEAGAWKSGGHGGSVVAHEASTSCNRASTRGTTSVMYACMLRLTRSLSWLKKSNQAMIRSSG